MITYTGNNAKVGFAEVFGYHIDALPVIDFLKGEKNTLYETVTDKHQVVLLDNIYLPVYYGKIDRKEYYIKYLTYSKDEMKNLLTENFQKFILGLEEKGVQIVEKNVKIVQNSNSMELIGDLLVIKSTGHSSPIGSAEVKE